ncbi:MAG: aminotransferase class V-fold PLP-dependent enzyme [Candidatus Bathyarchaeota archaeon]|jgi:selenocysteine lyase/cysteine desulfurase
MREIRNQFPITKNKIFLNHAGQSPLPKNVADIIHQYVNDISGLGSTSIEWEDGGKSYFAELIGAKTKEIAFIENTSLGLNIAANVLDYSPGSKIVTTDLEYPSVVYPWLRKRLGVAVDYIKNINGKIMIEDVEKAVDDKTRALVISHVEYANGFRHDLKALGEIAHDHGAYLIVDAIQSTGAVQVNVVQDEVDFLAASCYKWLLGPPGAGYLYVREDLIDQFEPPLVGWASVKKQVFETIDFFDIWKLELSDSACRYEIGCPSFISLTGAKEAIKILLKYGMKKIERRILSLTAYLIDLINDLGLTLQTSEEQQHRSGIVNFIVKDPLKAVEKLSEKGIIVAARTHGIRVSPHFYNSEEEIDKLIEEIKVIEEY